MLTALGAATHPLHIRLATHALHHHMGQAIRLPAQQPVSKWATWASSVAGVV
jgi:hypothetical protein